MVWNLWRNQTSTIELKCKENNSNGQFFSRSGPIWKEWKKKNLYTLLQNFWSCAIISQDGLLPTASQCKSPLAPRRRRRRAAVLQGHTGQTEGKNIWLQLNGRYNYDMHIPSLEFTNCNCSWHLNGSYELMSSSSRGCWESFLQNGVKFNMNSQFLLYT